VLFNVSVKKIAPEGAIFLFVTTLSY